MMQKANSQRFAPKADTSKESFGATAGKNIICGRYLVKERLGSGTFGRIYKAVDMSTHDMLAVKVERTRYGGGSSSIPKEAKIMQDVANETGFAKYYNNLKENDSQMLVMSCLGMNLEKLLQISSNQRMSLKSVLTVADQMMSRIEALHSHGWLHRDIKPENFTTGLGEDWRVIHLIDFGLSKQYIDPATGQHIPHREGKGMVGTARYMSINGHMGLEQSRRDDLEAIGYILIYLFKGRLPWQNLPIDDNEEKYRKIMELKMNIPVDRLCQDMPQAFQKYLTYVRRLTFTQTPDYKYLRKLFRNAFADNGFDLDYHFEWLDNDLYYDVLGTPKLRYNYIKMKPGREFLEGEGAAPLKPVLEVDLGDLDCEEIDEKLGFMPEIREFQSKSISQIHRNSERVASTDISSVGNKKLMRHHSSTQYNHLRIDNYNSFLNVPQAVDERSETVSKRMNMGSFKFLDKAPSESKSPVGNSKFTFATGGMLSSEKYLPADGITNPNDGSSPVPRKPRSPCYKKKASNI
jgi:serine/threonine protein kinase